MSEKSLWFDDGQEHGSAELAEFFGGVFGNGVNVFDNPDSLLVESDTGMNVKVNSGKAYINGRYYNSGGDLSIALTSAASNIKYVRIVLRVSISEKNIIAMPKESLSAVPSLTRDNDVYEISLAKITIPSGAATITSAMIVDERSNGDVCGFFRFAGHEAERVPAGVVDYFAGQIAPVGWLECDGRLISRSVYSDLFNAIGTIFGEGDGSTTFNLPDLRSEFIRGWDNGRGVDIDRVFGSSQEATAFEQNTYSLVRFINSEQNETKITEGRGLGSSYDTEKTVGRVRPRNVALLPIIKY